VVRTVIGLDPRRGGRAEPTERIISETSHTETHTTTIPGWVIGLLVIAVIVAISLALRLRRQRQDPA
jgi:hypothetical protein